MHDSRKVCGRGWFTWTESVDEREFLPKALVFRESISGNVFLDEFGMLLSEFVYDFKLSSVYC